jgi:hypothetical protein
LFNICQAAAMTSSLTSSALHSNSYSSSVLSAATAGLLIDNLNIWAVNVLFRIIFSAGVLPYASASSSSSGSTSVGKRRLQRPQTAALSRHTGAIKRSAVGRWGSRYGSSFTNI